MSDTTIPKYIIDSNVFIQSHRRYYQFGFCHGFWEWIERINYDNGLILSIDKVYEELTQGNDLLCKWVKERKDRFAKFDVESMKYVSEIHRILKEQGVEERKITEFVDNTKADAFLIAYAKAHNCTLITHEVRTNNIKAKKVHMPDVCDIIGVEYKTLFEIMSCDTSNCLVLSKKTTRLKKLGSA